MRRAVECGAGGRKFIWKRFPRKAKNGTSRPGSRGRVSRLWGEFGGKSGANSPTLEGRGRRDRTGLQVPLAVTCRDATAGSDGLPRSAATGTLVGVLGRLVDDLPRPLPLRTETHIRLRRRELCLAHEFVITGQTLGQQRP